jgi:hypothetical protein
MEFFCTLLQCRVDLSMFHLSSTQGCQFGRPSGKSRPKDVRQTRLDVCNGRPPTDGHSTRRGGAAYTPPIVGRPLRPMERPSAFQPSVGVGDQWSDGHPPCRLPTPTVGWSGERHAVRGGVGCVRTSGVRGRGRLDA